MITFEVGYSLNMGYQEVGVMVVVNLEVLLGMNLDPENPLRKDLTVN